MAAAVFAKDSAILDEMPLPLGGIMSGQNGEWVRGKLTVLREMAFAGLGANGRLMSLCFMSLPVLPALKITGMGLFDCPRSVHISPSNYCCLSGDFTTC